MLGIKNMYKIICYESTLVEKLTDVGVPAIRVGSSDIYDNVANWEVLIWWVHLSTYSFESALYNVLTFSF